MVGEKVMGGTVVGMMGEKVMVGTVGRNGG